MRKLLRTGGNEYSVGDEDPSGATIDAGSMLIMRIAHLRLLSLVACTVLAVSARPARAQAEAAPASEPSAETRAAAKDHFLRGLSLAKAGEWSPAFAEFSESARLFPTRAALSNVALSLSNLGRNVEAVSAYDEVLHRFGASMDASELSSLRATRDEVRTRVAELAVESEPGGASVRWDGRDVGTTPLPPILVDAGMHTVEVSKPGHVTFKKTFSVAAKQLLTVQATLGTQGAEGNIASRSTRSEQPAVPIALRETAHAYFELMGGLGLAPSFGGSADASCAREVSDPTDPQSTTVSGCLDRSRPFGLFAGARGGYALNSHLGLELFLGYLSLSASQVRRLGLRANSDDPSALFASRYEDTTKIRGPVTALSISYALLRRFPVVARAWLGMTVVNVSTTNSGSYAALPDDPSPQIRSVPEADQRAFIPFVGPEIQVGYPLSNKFQFGLSLATLVAFAPETQRAGTRSGGRRYFTSLSPMGTFDLPREEALGTFVLFVPNVWLRAGF